MALIWPILNSLIMIFILIVPGLFVRKRELLTEHQNDAISSIVVNLTWPCLVIDAMQLEFSIQTLKDTGYISAMATVIFAVLILISVPLAKLLRMS